MWYQKLNLCMHLQVGVCGRHMPGTAEPYSQEAGWLYLSLKVRPTPS